MFCKFHPVNLLCWLLGIAVILGLAGACSPQHYKADADEEVYNIIDGKWRDEFGIKANYTISDYNDPASPNDVEVAEMIPESGVINLQQAVEIATKFNRQYQSQKDSLYLSALSLTGTRYNYARQWFGTIDGTYTDNKSNGDDVELTTSGGVDQRLLLLDGVLFNIGIAIDWVRFLTGDPRTTLGSVLSGNVTVPLMGAGAGKVARENLTQAERSVLYDIRTFNRYRKTFVVGIISDYYNVLKARDSVDITEASYQRQVESVNQLKMEVDVGQRAPSDVDEAMQNLLSAENKLIRDQQSYEQALAKDLEGKIIGYTVPGLMDVLLEAFAKLNDIEQYSAVNVGFSIVQSLTAGKVDAVMGPFKTYETVIMAQKGYEVGYFELEKWGIPDYDELIFVTSVKAMKKNQAAIMTFRRVIDRAIAYVRANPTKALEYYFKAVPEADRKTESDAFELTLPYYAHTQKLDMKRWQQFADFALKYGLIEKPVDVKSVLWLNDN